MTAVYAVRRFAAIVVAIVVGMLASAAPSPRALNADSYQSLFTALRAELARAEFLTVQQPANLSSTSGDSHPSDFSEALLGQASLKLSPHVSAGTIAAEFYSAGLATLDTVPDLHVYRVSTGDLEAFSTLKARLSALPGVERVEPVLRLREQYQPNDPYYGSSQTYLRDLIHAEQAWDIQQGDPHVIMAVVDSGVDISHPELAGRIWTNPNPGHGGCGNDVHGCNFVNPRDVDPSCAAPGPEPAPNPDISPYYWHGTFVSGVLGAATNNGIGVAGIVPNATIMPVKVGDCMGPITTALAAGILYAVHNGAQIINLSIGVAGCKSAPADVLEAISQAQQAGVLVVAASGSDGTPCVGAPGNAAGVLAVGAVSASGDTRARFSQWGPEVAVVAPGTGIIGPVPPGTPGSFPPPDGMYAISDGTSFATPMVAGLADLLQSQNDLLTPLLLRRLIQRGATPLDDSTQPGWAGAGRIDMLASLKLVPAGFYGRINSNGAAVGGRSAVVARIGNQVCGQGLTTVMNGSAAYMVFVQPVSAQPGCGTPGATVHFSVAGRDAGQAPWSAAAMPVDLTVQSATLTDQAAGITFHAGWNLVAGIAGPAATQQTQAIYTLQPGESAYEVLNAGIPDESAAGYWVNFPRDTTLQVPVSQALPTTLTVPAGHYVLVGNSDTNRSVSVNGADTVYVFDTATQRYDTASTLQPGQGAWVLSKAGGTITLQ